MTEYYLAMIINIMKKKLILRNETRLRDRGPTWFIRFSISLASLVYGCAFAASIDCGSASTMIERLICNSAQLSALDSILNEAYGFALEDADYTERQEIIKTQKMWVNRKRNECDSEDCLASKYVARIQELAPINIGDISAQYVFDQAILSEKKADFQKAMNFTGIITGQLNECSRMIILSNTQKNPVYGAICSVDKNNREIMICDDTKFGRLTIKLEGLGISGKALAIFTAENCPAGG